MTTPTPPPCHILIADDEPANLRILAETLRDLGDITIARDGDEALARAKARPPDLMLLDIVMPGPDGYEVCRRARNDPALRHIPVIFCTNLGAEEDESRGFEVGGADYITKPFRPPLVRARVKTHLELKRHRDHLEALAESRARQLVHSERLATLGTLAAGIAHEINNPLACITLHADLLLHQLQDLPPPPPHAAPPLLDFLQSSRANLQTLMNDADRIARILVGMKGFARRDESALRPAPLDMAVENAIHLCAHRLKDRIETRIHFAPNLPPVLIRPQQIEQVLVNLINNAVDAIEESGRAGLIEIHAIRTNHHIRLTLDDNGTGIPADQLDAIWDPFTSTKGEKGTGLGLSISRGIVQEHGGELHAQNRPEGGARFTLSLPLLPDPPPAAPSP